MKHYVIDGRRYRSVAEGSLESCAVYEERGDCLLLIGRVHGKDKRAVVKCFVASKQEAEEFEAGRWG